MATHTALDRQTASDRLRCSFPGSPFMEEEAHPWRVRRHQRLQEPLLRVWDSKSGSQREHDGSLCSREPKMRLDTRESRRSSLSIHFDYRNWTPTPYISFTTSSSRVKKIAKKRSWRGDQMITVIDPNIRLQNGLPILSSKAEMIYYEIEDPYRRNRQYYNDEYLCLWQVTSAEVVGTWAWNDLKKHKDWYQTIILPAFERLTKTASARGVNGEVDALDRFQSRFASLSITRHSSSDSDGSDGWDTDDEVEEANRADDMLKMIEGDWL